MSKHSHQSKAEQRYNNAQGSASMNYGKMPSPRSEPMPSEDIQMKVLVDDRSIQVRAYQIHREKGGAALDNWLEAERLLKRKA